MCLTNEDKRKDFKTINVSKLTNDEMNLLHNDISSFLQDFPSGTLFEDAERVLLRRVGGILKVKRYVKTLLSQEKERQRLNAQSK